MRPLRLVKRSLTVVLAVCALYICFVAFKGLFVQPSNVEITEPYRLEPTASATEDKPEWRKILLVAYGRSGSSLTSAIIDRHPDVFSIFEPLFTLEQRHPGRIKGPRQTLIQTKRMQDSYDNECIAILEIFLNCSFESMNVEDIGNFQLRNSPGSRLLWECSLSTLQKTPRAALDCFLKARQACLRHPVKLVKSVRFRGQAVAQMMARNRDLKVLYLVRDPRGTISSQNIAFWKLVTDETLNYTRKFCQMFREDLAAIQPLFDRYPDRIKLVRYETLAEKPLLVSEELYGFLGLSFTSDVREFVFNSTSAGHKSTYNFATDRANSTSAAYAWRRRIHFPVVQATDQFCADVYRKLGYLPLRSEAELTDFRYKVKTDATFHGVAI